MIREKDGWYYCFDKLLKRVAPCKGAGVETIKASKLCRSIWVAPRMGYGN